MPIIPGCCMPIIPGCCMPMPMPIGYCYMPIPIPIGYCYMPMPIGYCYIPMPMFIPCIWPGRFGKPGGAGIIKSYFGGFGAA